MGKQKGARSLRVVSFRGEGSYGGEKEGGRRLGGAEDAWSGLTRPHPVCRRLRSCAVSLLSVVCATRRGYKRYAGARASLTLFLRSFVERRVSSSTQGRSPCKSSVLTLSFKKTNTFSVFLFLSLWPPSSGLSRPDRIPSELADISFYAEKRKRLLSVILPPGCCHFCALARVKETVYLIDKVIVRRLEKDIFILILLIFFRDFCVCCC